MLARSLDNFDASKIQYYLKSATSASRVAEGLGGIDAELPYLWRVRNMMVEVMGTH
jgi:hypothetical protein